MVVRLGLRFDISVAPLRAQPQNGGSAINLLRQWIGRRKACDEPVSPENDGEAAGSDLIYAIGDIHGRHDLLIALLEDIRLDTRRSLSRLTRKPDVYIVFLGDYIDRGDRSRDVIESLCQLNFDGTQLIYLKGNHEAIALDFLENRKIDKNWFQYGGRETLVSYGVKVPDDLVNPDNLVALKDAFIAAVPPSHLNFLRALKSYWIHGRYMFVHAGIDPSKDPESQTDSEYLWVRERFLNSIRQLPYIIVHGHTPEDAPTWDGRRIGIDTGAYISNRLTAVKLFNGGVEFITT